VGDRGGDRDAVPWAGLAKEVVSAATSHILEQGRLVLYVHDRTNLASAKVCRSLGYVEYAEEYFGKY
jgi:hypothetical protein